jgi:hypothetical protein
MVAGIKSLGHSTQSFPAHLPIEVNSPTGPFKGLTLFLESEDEGV